MGKDLKKQAVVIGATGNLGKAICKELAKNNFIIQEKWMKSNRPNILDNKAFDQLPKKIDAAMHQQKEKWVTLKKTIPVFIAYFTSWVDSNGVLQFRKDIYDLDDKMLALIFKN